MEEKTEKKTTAQAKPRTRTRKTPDHPTEKIMRSDGTTDVDNTVNTEVPTTEQADVSTENTSTELVNEIEKALDEVKVEVPEIKVKPEDVEPSEEMKTVNEIDKETDKQAEIFHSLIEQAKNDEELKKIVQDELKRSEETQKKLEEIVQKKVNKPKERPNITYTWNGVEYDF